MRTHRSARLLPSALVCLSLTMVAGARISAHDIPRDVTVRAFVRPEGRILRLVVRAPLRAILDVEYPRRDGDYVDLRNADRALRDAATGFLAGEIALYEGDSRLPTPRVVSVRMSLESERSFDSYDRAIAHVTGDRLPDDTRIFWEQGLLDVLLEYPIASDRSGFSIEAAFDRLGLRVVTMLQFLPPGAAARTFELQGDEGLVRLDPRWHQAAFRFAGLGFSHILDGTDHLLFLLCLVIPLRRLRALVAVVTAFTVAHSVTLIASVYDGIPGAQWFPPLVETLIALSIVYMALENIVAPRLARRWAVAFGFGLVHGFGFSFALRDATQFAGSHLLASLFSFNVGVELGQLLVLALLVPVLGLLFRFVVAERVGTILLSALVAHTGWHWTVERAGRLMRVPFEWSAFDPADAAVVLRLLMVIVVAGGAAWLAVAVLAPMRQRAGDKNACPTTAIPAGTRARRSGLATAGSCTVGRPSVNP